jgi:pyruvate,orthophosphate dikinase
VPPGFTITTEACNDYFTAGEKLPDGLWDDVLEAVHEVEALTGKGFGNAADPLLVSVRSGAKFSMPGMMDTVLNLGLNEETLNGLVALTGNERFGWDAYRRFIQMFGRIVMDVRGERFDHALEAAKERTSSWISRSRPSSPAGSASAPLTTGTTRRSPMTSARRSTS